VPARGKFAHHRRADHAVPPRTKTRTIVLLYGSAPTAATHLGMGTRSLQPDIALQSGGHKFVSNKTAQERFFSQSHFDLLGRVARASHAHRM
jgi:hypothetical protein